MGVGVELIMLNMENQSNAPNFVHQAKIVEVFQPIWFTKFVS